MSDEPTRDALPSPTRLLETRARATLKISRILDAFPVDEQRVIAFEVWRTFGGAPGDSKGNENHGETIAATTTERQHFRMRGKSNRGLTAQQRTNPLPSDSSLLVSGSVVASSESEKQLVLETSYAGAREQDFGRAKQLLDPKDFEFLCLCPEMFASQWLSDPERLLSLFDGYPKLNRQEEMSRYMAWVPRWKNGQPRRKDFMQGLASWFAKGESIRLAREMSKAVGRR